MVKIEIGFLLFDWMTWAGEECDLQQRFDENGTSRGNFNGVALRMRRGWVGGWVVQGDESQEGDRESVCYLLSSTLWDFLTIRLCTDNSCAFRSFFTSCRRFPV